MTDINELAQSLKAAAEKATQGNWRAFKYHDGRCGIGGGHHDEIMVCEHISKRRPHDAEFIALANPANILALVEALEKSEKTSEARREAIDRTFNMFVRERDRANAAEEALEKAQQVDEELCRLLPPGAEYMDPPDGGDVTPLEGVRRMVADYRQRIAELREWDAGLAQESFERQQCIIALQQRYEVDPRTHEIIDLKERITELESEVEKWKQEAEAWERVADEQLATAIELESRTVKLPTTRLWAGVAECYEKSDVIAAILSAGMEVSDD